MKISIFQKFYRRFVLTVNILTLFRSIFLKSLYYERPMNPLGSFISQEESELARQSAVPAALLTLFECVEIDQPTQRIGGTGDGSYVIAGTEFNDWLLISAGISNNNEFELQLADMGAKGLQFDGSIPYPPKLHERLAFFQTYVGKRFGFLALPEMTNMALAFMNTSPKAKILKLDIEGSEWELLANENLTDYDQIIIEIHGLFEVMRVNGDQKLQVLVNLVNDFYTIYVNGNNCCGFTNIGGYPIPNVAEFSLVNKKRYSRTNFTLLHPKPIINIPGRPPLRIWGLGS